MYIMYFIVYILYSVLGTDAATSANILSGVPRGAIR